VKSIASRFGFVGGLVMAVAGLAAACGSDEESPAPKPVVPKDARADVPADTSSDRGNDTSDAGADVSADTSDAGADTNDAGADTSADTTDAGADTSEGGSDASEGGADADAAQVLVLCPIMAGKTPVAPSPDGTQVAFLSCAKTTPAVVVYKIATKELTELGPAPADSSVEWLIGGKYVYYGSANETYVRAADLTADGAGPAVRISTGVIDGHRAFEERISNTAFAPRLLVLETVNGVRRISVRKPDDGYATPVVLIEDAKLERDISQLSASGRTLIATVTPDQDQALAEYKKIRTNLMQPTITMPFRPTDWVMAPTGLGDTHNFALNVTGDRLVRIELDTGVIAEIVPAGSGLLPGTAHIFDREEAPGKKYVYFIQNGDPSRRIREGTEPIEVLAVANAIAQAMSPDLATIVFLSDQQLFAVSAEGGGAPVRPLSQEPNTAPGLNVVFSTNTATKDFAYLVGPKLLRISLANDAQQLLSATANPNAVKFDGLGQSIVFMTDAGALQRVLPTSSSPDTIEPSVQGFWPVPTTSMVAVAINGQLVVRPLTP
jgi:hypothetical protein